MYHFYMLGFIFICFQISFFAVSRDDFCIITNGKYTIPQLININSKLQTLYWHLKLHIKIWCC
jgi:hypothetical protein